MTDQLNEADQKFNEEIGGPNPELYERLSQPYPNHASANDALNTFLIGVKKLREECGIAEALVMVAAHYLPDGADENKTVSVKALALGSPEFRAELGALAFQQYTAPEIERAERLRALATTPGMGKRR